MTSTLPVTISVVIVTRDRLALLREAVASVLAQTRPAEEIVVVDDGSKDGTTEWLRTLASIEPRVVVECTGPRGIASARQTGLLKASGTHVCVLDSDDRLLPGALRSLVAVLEAGHDVAYGHMLERTPDGKVREIRFPSYDTNVRMTRAILGRPRVPFKHSGLTVPRERTLALGGYDVDLPIKVDIELVLRLLRGDLSFGLTEEPVVEFLMHDEGISTARLKGFRVWVRLIAKYGPDNAIARGWLVAVRGLSEFGKLVVWKLKS